MIMNDMHMENYMGGGNKRSTLYDWLRLIATIFVVVGHSAYLNIQTTYGGVNYVLSENISIVYNSRIFIWLRYLSGWVYGFHMPLFFMLSGAVLALKPIAKFDIIVKSKVKRLLIPYYVYGWFFMLPIKRIGGFYNNESLRLAMKGFLYGADSGHLWFLTALFWCIIAFVMIFKFLKMLNINSNYLILFISGVIYLTYNYLPFDVMGIKTGLSYLFYFSIGYVFESERKLKKHWEMRKVIFAYAIILCIEIINKKFDILNPFFLILMGSFMTYLFADILDHYFNNISENRLWKIISRNLFYIYLFHDPLEYIVLRIFMNRNLLENAIGCVMYPTMRIVGVFVVSLLLGEIVTCMKRKIGYLLNQG